MLLKSDWIIDTRPLRGNSRAWRQEYTWEEWLKKHPKPKEQWLMAIIEMLLKNQDWAGPYILMQTYINTCKQHEGTLYYNRTPYDESVHVRAVRHWFWSLVKEYGFAMPEEETPYDDQNIYDRRSADKKAEESYPFVGGKPKRRYSEAVEFFQAISEGRFGDDRVRPVDTAGKKKTRIWKPTLKV